MEPPGKGEESMGNWGEITRFPPLLLLPTPIHFPFVRTGDCLRGAVIPNIKLEQFRPLL